MENIGGITSMVFGVFVCEVECIPGFSHKKVECLFDAEMFIKGMNMREEMISISFSAINI